MDTAAHTTCHTQRELSQPTHPRSPHVICVKPRIFYLRARVSRARRPSLRPDHRFLLFYDLADALGCPAARPNTVTIAAVNLVALHVVGPANGP